MPGVPDVLVTDSSGRFHLIELKNCKTKSVKLSPHQVSFLSAHSDSLVWLLIRSTPTSAPDKYYLYTGDQVPEVQAKGLAFPPLFTSFEIEPIISLIDRYELSI
jgi:hypothetical protein